MMDHGILQSDGSVRRIALFDESGKRIWENVEAIEAMYASPSRMIARTYIDEVMVSTVFLCLNHGWSGQYDIWFETMVFGGPEAIDQQMDRYATMKDARDGHRAMVAMVREALESIRLAQLQETPSILRYLFEEPSREFDVIKEKN